MNAAPANPLRLILSHADYLFNKTRMDLKIRYKKTLLGTSWVFIMPLLFLAIYSLVHIYIYGVHPQNISSLQFVLMMFCGLMSVFGFSESLSASSEAFSTNRSLLLYSYMNPEILTAQTTLLGFINCIIGLSLAIATLLLTGYGHVFMVFAPVVLFFQMLFVIGLGWFFSILTLLVKDLQFFIRFITLLLVIASPIAYTYDMVPPRLAPVIYLNPISYFIIPYQDLLIFGRIPPLNVMIGMVLISSLTFLLGYKFFMRMRMTMADYL